MTSQPNVNNLCELMNTKTNANFHFVLHEGTRASVDSFAHQLEQQQMIHNWYNRGHITLLIDASADEEGSDDEA